MTGEMLMLIGRPSPLLYSEAVEAEYVVVKVGCSDEVIDNEVAVAES